MEISEHDDTGNSMQLMEEEEYVEGTRGKRENLLAQQRLKLEISDSFLSSVRLTLGWYRNDSFQIKYNDRSKYEEIKTARNQLISGKISKVVPTELPLLTLSIGNEKFIRSDECDIFTKFCYLGKKVVCQMCNSKLSRKVDIPFSDITSLLVCIDHGGFDTLRVEAKSPFKSFIADKPRPGKFLDWKVEDSKEEDCFPEAKFVFLEIQKGTLEKGLAKLLYTDPRLEHVVNISRGNSCDQYMYQGSVHTHLKQTNMFAVHPLSSNNVFPYIGGN